MQTQKYIYYVFHNWIKKLFSEENKVPEHCLKLERWQGPPCINKGKQFTGRENKVCLFSLFGV